MTAAFMLLVELRLRLRVRYIHAHVRRKYTLNVLCNPQKSCTLYAYVCAVCVLSIKLDGMVLVREARKLVVRLKLNPEGYIEQAE